MKLSEIARYWAAKELTSITAGKNKVSIKAPFATRGFTLRVNSTLQNPRIKKDGVEAKPLVRVKDMQSLKDNTLYPDKTGSIVCFQLEKGICELVF